MRPVFIPNEYPPVLTEVDPVEDVLGQAMANVLSVNVTREQLDEIVRQLKVNHVVLAL